MIKDRLIEVDLGEALALAGIGETVRCVGEGTGLMTIADVLDGLTFFAPESALTEKVEPVRIEASKDEIAKLAKSDFAPVMVQFDTPENRTRAIIDSVERYDEEHGDPPTTRQEEPEQEEPKAEAPKEVPGFVPFALAPSGGGALKK